MRESDDALWGLGLGCEGAMQILLLPAGPANDWQPLAHFSASLAAHRPTAAGIVVESASADVPVGSVALPLAPQAPPPAACRGSPLSALSGLQAALARAIADRRSGWLEEGSLRLFVLPLWLPPRIVLLGAGPDAVPVVEFATRLGWEVTLADHRPAYAVAAHFPAAERVILTRPEALSTVLDLESFSAAIVMSHHLPSDLAYLRALVATAIPYVGLLGPAVRRERLLGDLGADAHALRGRLYAPVGLPLGGREPESIALAIVAQLHAFVHGAARFAAPSPEVA